MRIDDLNLHSIFTFEQKLVRVDGSRRDVRKIRLVLRLLVSDFGSECRDCGERYFVCLGEVGEDGYSSVRPTRTPSDASTARIEMNVNFSTQDTYPVPVTSNETAVIPLTNRLMMWWRA